MPRSAKFQKLRDALVLTLEDIVKFRGNDPMIARIYAMIILSPDPLTQEQIAEETGYSRSQISRYLSNLEGRRMISRESQPGSKTQLYGGSTAPFLNGFKEALDIAERFIKGKIEILNRMNVEWEKLSKADRTSKEASKLHEVIAVLSSWFASYIDLLSEFNKRFEERLSELELEMAATLF